MKQQIQQAGGELCGIYICPHHPDEQCDCRKPKPKLYLDIIAKHAPVDDIIWCIGDSARDIEAGIKTQCRTALVLTGNGRQQQSQLRDSSTRIYADLASAVHDILANSYSYI